METMLLENAADFGRAVRTARKEAGLSQNQLAEKCSCSQRLVSEIERGKETAELGKALGLLVGLGIPLTAGSPHSNLDGRAEVNYALVRIASKLDEQPRPHRPLHYYLNGVADE